MQSLFLQALPTESAVLLNGCSDVGIAGCQVLQGDPEQARIVELRYFVGLGIDETAEILGISPATLKRRWALARAWLFRELSPV